ncbi:MAG: molecular chaperone GrpE [Solirubrobacterales bacterium]|jgi:molecular chaperone GrpE|nr:molecular chaperone GrpE [Solirubrobacterales bacterium]MDX6663472.1 molecular chaperone GrpE [Solirubrobacterales bacterium]
MSTRRRAGEPESRPGPAGSADGLPQQPLTEEEPPAAAELDSERVESDLDALLAEARRERDEYLELAQRAKADFENYRRRAAAEAAEVGRRSVAELAAELVPALDNLERALRAAGVEPDAADQPAEGADVDALLRGVLLTYREMRSILERAGVESYDPAGERFDPTWHEALQTRSAEGVEPGQVVEVLERGYRLDDRVVRPARVVVSA